MLFIDKSENTGIEETNNNNSEVTRYLKLVCGRFLKKITDNINKISTMLIGIINAETIFLSRNKSIKLNKGYLEIKTTIAKFYQLNTKNNILSHLKVYCF